MATIRQRESGYWQAVVRRKGQVDQSKSFRLLADAEAWARAIEGEIDRGLFVSRDKAERTTFASVAERFEKEVLPTKRGGDRDVYRLRRLVEEFGRHSLASINQEMIASYRDMRLKTLSNQSVVHELTLLSRVFRTCTMDWGIPLVGGIPTAGVRKPRVSNERTRRLEAGEEDRLLTALGQCRNRWVLPVVRFALETAARQSEILSLTWADVDLKTKVARLRGIEGGETKNNDSFRDVPLSSRAVTLLTALPRTLRGPVFPVTASSVKQAWGHAVARARRGYLADCEKDGSDADPALLVDLHFHDLRHEATSRMAEKLQMHELMKVTGHKSTQMLARYYHPRAEDLARKLG